jgi:hypothetical protein
MTAQRLQPYSDPSEGSPGTPDVTIIVSEDGPYVEGDVRITTDDGRELDFDGTLGN